MEAERLQTLVDERVKEPIQHVQRGPFFGVYAEYCGICQYAKYPEHGTTMASFQKTSLNPAVQCSLRGAAS